jgi:hypothetical protein
VGVRNQAHIEIEIQELVLHGFSRADGDRIAEAVTHELENLFARGAFTSGLREDHHIDAIRSRPIQAGANQPDRIGVHIAETIQRELIR